MTFLQVALQGVLECLHPAKDPGLVVPIINAFAIVVDSDFIPVSAKNDVLLINTPGKCIDDLVVHSKARICVPFNRALDIRLAILEALLAIGPEPVVALITRPTSSGPFCFLYPRGKKGEKNM
eukprot:13954516-Ditylum_brightwellii.AAC.1